MCFPCCVIVSTSEVVLLERFGQFHRLAQPGINMYCFPCEKKAGLLSFRVQQLNVRIETKTLDNVFLTAVVSVQYQVLRDKTYDAFYALTNPVQQITAHVYDVRCWCCYCNCNCICSVVVVVVGVLHVILYFGCFPPSSHFQLLNDSTIFQKNI
jgi:SPFH domain / Band 7 family